MYKLDFPKELIAANRNGKTLANVELLLSQLPVELLRMLVKELEDNEE